MRAILVGNVEDGVGDLAGHHVDLVDVGHRDDHVGVGGPCPLQHVRVRPVADDALDVEAVAQRLDQARGLVDDGDVIVLRQALGNSPADLAGAADDDFHEKAWIRTPRLVNDSPSPAPDAGSLLLSARLEHLIWHRPS
jgi:hypothetical protein